MTASTPPGDAALAWTAEAQERLDRAPAFVRPGIVKLMAKRARERGRAVVDAEFLTEIRNESMLLVARCLRWVGHGASTRDRMFHCAGARHHHRDSLKLTHSRRGRANRV